MGKLGVIESGYRNITRDVDVPGSQFSDDAERGCVTHGEDCIDVGPPSQDRMRRSMAALGGKTTDDGSFR